VTDHWQELTSRLERVTARLAASAPDDRPRLGTVLKERKETIEQLAALVQMDPSDASPELLDRLKAAQAAGRDYVVRLRLQTEWLRLQLGAATSQSRLLNSFAVPGALPRRRINLRS